MDELKSIRIGVSNTIKILDLAKTTFDLKNDAELARFIGVTRATISTFRKLRGSIGDKFVVVLLEKIQYQGASNWSERLSVPYLQQRILDAGIECELSYTESAQSVFINLLKNLFESKNDYELAEHLGLMPNTLSMFRVGRTTLGVLPLMRTYAKIEGKNFAELAKPITDKDRGTCLELLGNFAKTTPTHK
jgi:hypothetical protein